MQNQLLLLEDVESLGRSGEIVSVKPGYARNFLLPQRKAVVADKHTLRLQAKLVEERAKKAAVDKADSEALAARLATLDLCTEVKVDEEGRMYGSVTAIDIVKICAQQGLTVEKKHVLLLHPIKALGSYTIQLKLKEGVSASLRLKVVGDRVIAQHVVKPLEEETSVEEVESE